MLNHNDVLITKEKLDDNLPEGFEVEKDVILHYWTTIYKRSLCAVAFVRKNGKRRLSEEDGEMVIKILRKLTGCEWHVDNVSSFVFHLDKNQLFPEWQKMSLFEVRP